MKKLLILALFGAGALNAVKPSGASAVAQNALAVLADDIAAQKADVYERSKPFADFLAAQEADAAVKTGAVGVYSKQLIQGTGLAKTGEVSRRLIKGKCKPVDRDIVCNSMMTNPPKLTSVTCHNYNMQTAVHDPSRIDTYQVDVHNGEGIQECGFVISDLDKHCPGKGETGICAKSYTTTDTTT